MLVALKLPKKKCFTVRIDDRPFFFIARPPWIRNVFRPDTIMVFQETFDSESFIGIQVKVNRVVSPGRFYWSLVKKFSALTLLTKKMGNLYDEKFGKLYSLERDQTYLGQIIAVKFKNMQWYRARIIRLYAEPFIDVIYIDYGTKSRVHIDVARHLHIDFTYFPIQGLRGHLFGIEPKCSESGYSSKAIKLFRSSVKGQNKVLTATVCEVKNTGTKYLKEILPYQSKDYGLTLTDYSFYEKGVDVAQRCLSLDIIRVIFERNSNIVLGGK